MSEAAAHTKVQFRFVALAGRLGFDTHSASEMQPTGLKRIRQGAAADALACGTTATRGGR
jgi:hypothetical protein